MSYIEDGGFFSPICKHFIDLDQIRQANWLQCECGKWFNYSLLVDLESAKGRLEVAQDDVRFLQAEVARVAAQGSGSVIKRFIKSVVPSFRSNELGSQPAPAARPSTVAVPYVAPAVHTPASYTPAPAAQTPAQAYAAPAYAPPAYTPPAPAQPKVPERPRGLAKSENRRQIGLFITAVTMVMVAFISYIGWGASQNPPIAPGVQVPIASAVVIGLGVVAVRARRLSRVLSNVLALTSSVLALVSLWALAYYNVWGAKSEWVGNDWAQYPYVALIPLILAILTIYPGYRFKIAGWLNPTAVLFAISGVIFNLSYEQNAIFANTEKLSLGWQLLAPTVTAALVLVAGRYSRSKLADLPEQEEVEKLIGAPEDERREYYELVDRHREQMLLNRTNRLSLLGLLAVMAAHLVANLIGLASGKQLDGAGLLVLGFVWLGLTVAIETIGSGFTVSGAVANSVKRGAWITAIGSIGLGISTTTLNSSSFDPSNIVIAGIIWLVGAALVFAPTLSAWAKAKTEFAFAANLTAFVVWASWFVYAIANNVFSTPAAFTASAVFAIAIALTLIAQNFITKSANLQIAAVVASTLGALLSFGGSRVGGGAATPTSEAVALLIALALINLFTIVNAFITSRAAASESVSVRAVTIVANCAAVIAAAPAVLGNLYNSDNTIADANSFWPVLLVLVLFAGGLLVIPNLRFANKEDSILSKQGRLTLVGQAVLYLGSGFLYLVTLANNPNVFLTVSGYTFAVMLIVLSYGAIRRVVWGITASYGLSTVFSIAVGEAAMFTQNSSHAGNTTTWAIWFLVPFAALTYLHLLIMRLRAEASVLYKVAIGVGGFALTSLVYEITRATNQSNTPAVDSVLADYLQNRVVNVATLLGLGALVLVLRLVPAVRKDVARDQVLNLSGLLALALAVVDSVTTPSGTDNLETRVALLVVTVLLLINSRTSFAMPQVIAAFFVGQGLLYNLAQWVSAETNWLPTGDAGAAIAVAGPYILFLLSLGWFAAISKLGSKAEVSNRVKTIALGVTGIIAVIQVAATANPDKTDTTLVAASATLALLFVWRWIARKSEVQLGVMGAGVLVWAAGAVATINGLVGQTGYLLVAEVLVIPAALLLIDSLITRKAISTVIGSVPLLVASWMFAGAIIQGGSAFALWHLVLPVVAFTVASLVLASLKAHSTLPLWFASIAPISLVGGIAELSTASAGLAQNQVDWPVTLVLAIAVLVFAMRTGGKLSQAVKTAVLASSGILWLTGLIVLLSTGDRTDAFGGLSYDTLIYVGVSTVVLFWHAIAAKSRQTLALGVVATIWTSVLVDGIVHNELNWFAGPEVGALVAAVGLAFASNAYRKVVGPVKSTLFTWGIPTIAILWPSVFYTFTSNQIAQPWNELDPAGVIRLIALAIVGTAVMLVGIRLANRGLVYAAVSTLLLEFVPALWNAIGNQFKNSGYENELRGLLIAVTFVVLQTIFKRLINLKINSIAVWGIPAVITLAPSLIDVWGALGHQVDTSDWVRFVVLVCVSTGFLILGSIRRISGLFYPGFIGVISAVLPYAFSSNAGGGLWIVGALVVLAALIIWVAVRIDRFTGWLKELN